MSQFSTASYMFQEPTPQFGNYLVVSKSFYNESFKIVGCDNQRLINISLPNEYKIDITAENFYQFPLVNPLNQAPIAAFTVSVQGKPVYFVNDQAGMFSALMKFAYTAAFSEIYMSVPGEPYIDGKNVHQPPKAMLVAGDMIMQSKKVDGKTRCLIRSGGSVLDMRYMGTHCDSYNNLPVRFTPYFSMNNYILILVVADPIAGPWFRTRSYILVTAVYRK